MLPPCLSFPFVKLGEVERKETPSLLLCLRTFLWLCCGIGSCSTSLGGEQGGQAVVLVLPMCLCMSSWPSLSQCSTYGCPTPSAKGSGVQNPLQLGSVHWERGSARSQRVLRRFLGSSPHVGGSALCLGAEGAGSVSSRDYDCYKKHQHLSSLLPKALRGGRRELKSNLLHGRDAGMGAVRIARHAHETPSSSASPKILPWAKMPLPMLFLGPCYWITRNLSPAQTLWGARRGLRGQLSLERGSWLVRRAHEGAALFACPKQKRGALLHPHSLTHLPGPVLPPCFKGPLRELEMSSKMQSAAWVHGWTEKH